MEEKMDKTKGFLDMTGFASFWEPDAVSANSGAAAIVTEVDMNTLTGYTTAAGGAATVAAQADYARNLLVFITDANASVTGGTVTVVGTDQNGEGISEDFTMTGGGTETLTGSKAFAHVTSVTVKSVTGTAGAGDKVAVGIGNKLGLPASPDAIYGRLVKATYDGGDESGTFNATYGTYAPAGTLNASDEVEVSYTYRVPIVQ
jgi:hypothetical protein